MDRSLTEGKKEGAAIYTPYSHSNMRIDLDQDHIGKNINLFRQPSSTKSHPSTKFQKQGTESLLENLQDTNHPPRKKISDTLLVPWTQQHPRKQRGISNHKAGNQQSPHIGPRNATTKPKPIMPNNQAGGVGTSPCRRSSQEIPLQN
ncbi:hypothetical protein O181_015651 [Austropuccinia psidii MF-1]|uniref:Uncharacterized protein n=1 Tax=Austropuccinia psidii MF-1 TaxID=1389203 RepID=A0A9Q3C0A9_9BASI|nr:hypothetical protein [Austropuccinia psidii MF-1]